MDGTDTKAVQDDGLRQSVRGRRHTAAEGAMAALAVNTERLSEDTA